MLADVNAIADDILRERGLLIPRDSNFCREKSRSTRTITRAPRIQVHSCMQHGSRGQIIRVLIITRESASRDTIEAPRGGRRARQHPSEFSERATRARGASLFASRFDRTFDFFDFLRPIEFAPLAEAR